MLSPTVDNVGMPEQVVLSAQRGIMYDRLWPEHNLPNTAIAQRVFTSGQKTLPHARPCCLLHLHLIDSLTTCSPKLDDTYAFIARLFRQHYERFGTTIVE